MSTNTSPKAQNHLRAIWDEAAEGTPVIWDGLPYNQAVAKRQAAYTIRAREREQYRKSFPNASGHDWDVVQIHIIPSPKFPGKHALLFVKDYSDIEGEIRNHATGAVLHYDPQVDSLLQGPPPATPAPKDATPGPATSSDPFDTPLAPGESLGLGKPRSK